MPASILWSGVRRAAARFQRIPVPGHKLSLSVFLHDSGDNEKSVSEKWMPGQGSGFLAWYDITITRSDIFVHRDIAHFNGGITLESGESPNLQVGVIKDISILN